MPPSNDIIDRTLRTTHGEQAYAVAETLTDAGHDAWWVGGCVRDMLMGNVPRDIDIATSALPQQITALFRKCDASSAALGAVLVSLGGAVFEVTTFREDDAASDGRHPESVRFTADRGKDAARRDVTVNAMYWHPISRELHDPFEGEKDLRERLIRFIGDPDTRLTHDALRLLRAVRFRAAIDGQYHPDTFAALHRNAKRIGVLSGTRRFRELEKMLLGPHPEVALEDLWETDVIEELIPELHACKGVAQPMNPHGKNDVWTHTMHCIASFTDDHGADVRWAALFHDVGKPRTFTIEEDRIHFNNHASVGADITKAVLDRLQCPGNRRDKIAWLVGHHMMMATFGTLDIERKGHWYYHPWFLELLQLFWLDIAGTHDRRFGFYEEIVADYNRFLDEHPLPPRPLLSGHEVMEMLGLTPGEEVGRILRALYDRQITGAITTRAEALSALAEIAKKN